MTLLLLVLPMMRFTSNSSAAKQPQKLLSLALLGAVMFGAVSTPAAVALPHPSQPLIAQLKQAQAAKAKTRLPQMVMRRVKQDLVQRFELRSRDLKVVSFSRETWGDSCLGLAQPNERCAMATVEGWRVEMTNGKENWVYRTDLKAQVIRIETQDPSALPPQVVDRLFETIAQQTRVPASSLRVLESKAATFDGCMGIYEPGRACTRIAISGWKVIVAGDRQQWVYHVSEDASRIAQNATASGSRGEVFTSFIPEGNEPPAPIGENVVFRLSVSGGLTGSVTDTYLTADGTLYSQTRGPNSPTSGPKVMKRLSQQQLSQFQQVLEQQRVPNMNGLRFFTSAAFADYPTSTVQAMGSTFEYIDIDKEGLPQALQALIQAWEKL
ncbi:hypothetical protein H6F90_14865 [Trichocoleus sp. FACHB-591]|uniref:hypothetical protein n=1 Tax=Trichocoleus sp. FACHB-591 TaxID=2692872 RepID=UPI001684BF6C|nr:hypothetical protein [Trichocoleus sp. FACHB-591]MBD2096421.1 hypothetical protein [Trichocoleus sp. FACHB-591]